MNKECYFLAPNDNHDEFNFKSRGIRGIIEKIIRYERIGINFYNLWFGDWD